jgi:hypothetical protein
MLTPMVSVFCLFVLLYHITAASSTNPSYIAVDDIKLDCGSDRKLEGFGWARLDWRQQLKFFPREEDNLKSNISEPPKEGIVQTSPLHHCTYILFSIHLRVFGHPLAPNLFGCSFTRPLTQVLSRSTDFFTVKAGSFTLLRNFSASILVDSLQGRLCL